MKPVGSDKRGMLSPKMVTVEFSVEKSGKPDWGADTINNRSEVVILVI